MIVVQDIQNQTTLALAQTFQWCGLEYILWNPEKVSIFDMFYECRPNLVIVNKRLYRTRGEELLAGRKNNNKICVLGTRMVAAAENLFCLDPAPFANLITNTNVKDDPAYACDASIITADLSEDDIDHLPVFIHKILRSEWFGDDSTLRIYGPKVIDHPCWVGNIQREDYNLIYRNSATLYDFTGDHYLNSFLHNNLGHRVYANMHNIEITPDGIVRNNFEAAALILANCGVEQMIVDHIKTKGTEFVDKYWNSSE